MWNWCASFDFNRMSACGRNKSVKRMLHYKYQTPKHPECFISRVESMKCPTSFTPLVQVSNQTGLRMLLARRAKIRARRGALVPGWAGWRRPPWSATSCVGWQISWRALHVGPWWGVHTALLSHSEKRWCPHVWNARLRPAPRSRRHTAPPKRRGRPLRHCLRTRWPPVDNTRYI